MIFGLRAFVALVSLAFLFFVALMVRRQRFLLKYSFFWLLLGVVGLIVALWPDGMIALSGALGFEMPVNFLFFCCIIILMGVCLTLCGVVSTQARRIVSLVQEVSILKASMDDTVPTDDIPRL